MIYLKSVYSLKSCHVFVALVLLAACSKGDKEPPAEPVNQVPKVMAQVFNTQTEVVIHDKLVAQDPEHQMLSFNLVRAPVLGQLSLAGDGNFSYNPNEETTGTDSFVFSVNDGINPGVTANVTITITALRVNLSRFSRNAFEQQANDVPLKINGRIFTDDIDSSDFYADLFINP